MAPRKSSPPARRKKAARLEPPSDWVLSPQTERPRHRKGIDQSEQARQVTELSWKELDGMVKKLVAKLSRAFRPTAILGVAHGGVFVGGAVASALGCQFFPVRIEKRSRDRLPLGSLPLYGQLPKKLEGAKLLVVDDVASSGDTLERACALAKKVGVKEVRTAVLLARSNGYVPDYFATQSDLLHVFPWDLQPVAEDARFDVDPDKAEA